MHAYVSAVHAYAIKPDQGLCKLMFLICLNRHLEFIFLDSRTLMPNWHLQRLYAL
jgi:hypothetical protein